MTQEDKDLLLKDLCTRLPYGVKVEAKGLLKTFADEYDDRNIINVHVLNGLNLRDCFKTYSIDCMVNIPLFNRKGICNIKPYLFPLSSMTEEQKREYNSLRDFVPTYYYEYGDIVEDTELYDNWDSIDYLIANHFDYRGLIPKDLAIDATGLKIY